MEVKEQTIDLKQFTPEQLKELYNQARENERREKNQKRDAYEGIRAEVVHNIFRKVEAVTSDVQALHTFVAGETAAFKQVMEEYGQLREGGQMRFQLQDENMRISVASQKVKKFDERADVAEIRLMNFLKDWIKKAPNGSDDVMYQMAMLMIERNNAGDLDYKSISKLYEMEGKFNAVEYTEIMDLFRESHVVNGTATRYYFEKRDKNGVWRKIEPSFNRMY